MGWRPQKRRLVGRRRSRRAVRCRCRPSSAGAYQSTSVQAPIRPDQRFSHWNSGPADPIASLLYRLQNASTAFIRRRLSVVT